MKRTLIALALASAGLTACETTLISQQLDYYEMQGVGFSTDFEEDAVLGGAQIVHRAYNSNNVPVCARVVGFSYVIVPAGQSAVLANRSPGARSASFEVGPVRAAGAASRARRGQPDWQLAWPQAM